MNFDRNARNVPTIAEFAAGVLPAGYMTADGRTSPRQVTPTGIVGAPRTLVRSPIARTYDPPAIASAPVGEGWHVAELLPDGSFRVAVSGSLDHCSAWTRSLESYLLGAGRSYVVIRSELVPA